MESIVLAISGLSFLGVSAVLRRTAAKHIHTVRTMTYSNTQAAQPKPDFNPHRLEGPALLQRPLPALLSRESSSLLQQ